MSARHPSRQPDNHVTVTLTAREAELAREAIASEMTRWLTEAAEDMRPAVGEEEYIGMVDARSGLARPPRSRRTRVILASCEDFGGRRAAWKLRLAADLLAVLDGPLGLPFRQRHDAALAKLQAGEKS